VAKRYIRADASRDIYFDDIKMQMVSKRYAKLYNVKEPPKGVDFLMAFVLEVERGGKTWSFAVERAIEDESAFVKYNNNSGFVDYGGSGDAQHHMAHRLTPHAFSRFTFERSGGELMVVDIQGCDDVYTDPQIHTLRGDDFGEGNLGLGGMALFFSTSKHDSLCERLGLIRFCLSQAEESRLANHAAEATKAERNSFNLEMDDSTGVKVVCPNSKLLARLEERLSQRRCSSVGMAAKLQAASHRARAVRLLCGLERLSERPSEGPTEDAGADEPPPAASRDENDEHEEYEVLIKALPLHLLHTDEAAAAARTAVGLPGMAPTGGAPAGGVDTAAGGHGISPAAIGGVHAKMCEYALTGRLPLQQDQADVASAAHHLVCAAAGNEARALRDLKALCHGLPASELLVGVKLREVDVPHVQWLLPHLTARLAAGGDVASMVELAATCADADSVSDSVAWLRAALGAYDASSAEEQSALSQFGLSRYQLLQRQAETILKQPGPRSEVRSQAAAAYEEASEAAMEAGKAKVAMKLSALAEDFGGEGDDDEEEGAEA